MSPLCESYLSADQLNTMEPFYPLNVRVCGECFLAQVEEYVTPDDIFREYAYFSSYAQSWVDHARQYTAMAVERFRLGPSSRIVGWPSLTGTLCPWMPLFGLIEVSVGGRSRFTVNDCGPLVPPEVVTVTF